MKKRLGNTLIEVLMALCVLGIVIPTSLGALGSVLAANLKIQESSYMISSAEWWFGRLTFSASPAHIADLNAAPRSDRYGKVRFEWDTKDLSNGAILVTLRVYGRLSASPFTVSRIL